MKTIFYPFLTITKLLTLCCVLLAYSQGQSQNITPNRDFVKSTEQRFSGTHYTNIRPAFRDNGNNTTSGGFITGTRNVLADDAIASVCSTCENVEVFLKPEAAYSDTTCCNEFFIDAHEGACDVYGVRLISTSGFLATHADVEWNTVQQSADSITWMSNGNPLVYGVNGSSVFVADICFNPGPATKTITVQYLDSNGNVLCQETFTNTCCKNCEEGLYNIEIEGVQKNQNNCCVKVNISLDSSACEVGLIEVKPDGGSYQWYTFNPPIQPGQSRDSVAVICTGSGASPQNFSIKILDKMGFLVCKDSVKIDCNDCCLWTHVSLMPDFVINPGYCSGNITAWFDSTELCDIVTTWTDAPIDLVTVVNSRTTIFHYVLTYAMRGIYHVYYTNSQGDTVCTKEIELNCFEIINPCADCGFYGYTLKPETEESNSSCCYEFFAETTEDACAVYAVRMRSAAGFMSSSTDIFWTKTQNTPTSITWTNNGNPIVPGDGELIALTCFSPSPNARVVYIDYLDGAGGVLCTDTVIINCCKKCAEGMYNIEVEGIQRNPGNCCVQLNLDLANNACALGSVEVYLQGSGFPINTKFFNPPLQPGQSKDSIMMICTPPGINPQNYIIKYYDANGFLACTDTIEVDCNNCCNWAHVDNVPIYNPNPNFCKGYIKAVYDSVNYCHYAYAICPGPITMVTTPNPRETRFFYNLSAGTSYIFYVYFININGDTICTKDVLVNCPMSKTGPDTHDEPTVYENTELPVIRCIPNPASGYTTITYYLPEAGTVTLDLVNSTGMQLETLEKGEMIAGTHKYILSTAHYPSGVYIVRMVYKGRVFYTRLSILK